MYFPGSGVPLPGQRPVREGPRGFTLVELTIVVAIIAVLAATGVYIYRGVVAKARMTQARTVLSHLARTESIYFASNDRYTDNVALLDFDPVRYPLYHVTVVLDNDAKGFTGIATGVGPMSGDRWFITNVGNPVQDNASPFR